MFINKPQTAHEKLPAVFAVSIDDSNSKPSPAQILHKLVRHVRIGFSKLRDIPDHGTLRNISDRQGAIWETCAIKLGLSLVDIDDLKLDYRLVIWKHRQSFMATYEILVKVFISVNNVDLAKYVCELLK